jgi:hypothetical protein
MNEWVRFCSHYAQYVGGEKKKKERKKERKENERKKRNNFDLSCYLP